MDTMRGRANSNQVTANEITSYQGRAEFGLADDGLMETGVVETPNSDKLLDRMMYLNIQKNLIAYNKKIEDRDEVMRTVAENSQAITQALPEDRERLQQQLKEIKQMMINNGGDIKSDPKVWAEFNDRLAKFREANTYAKSRYDTYTKGASEAAKETDPMKKKRMQEHYEAQRKKDMYDVMDPYQQSLDYDLAIVGTPLETISTKVGTKDAYVTYNDKTDLDKSYRKYNLLYRHDDKQGIGTNVDAFLTDFYGQNGMLPIDGVMRNIQDVNKRLQEIAVAEGLDPSKPEKLPSYLQPIKVANVGGKIQSLGYKSDDWFKIMAASQYKNGQRSEYDKDLAAQMKTKADIDATKALAEQRRSAGRYNDARTKAVREKAATEKEMMHPRQFYDEVFKTGANIGITPKGNVVTRINDADMSVGLKKVLGIRPLNKRGEYNLVPTNITQNGKKISEEEFHEAHKAWYNTTRKTLYNRDADGKVIDMKYRDGGFIDYLQYLEEEGKQPVSYEIEIVGKDAQGKLVRSNAMSSYMNQRKEMKITGGKFQMDEFGDVAGEQ